jgi:cholesterol oxidase
MSGGLTFKETMEGPLAMGATDPTSGAAAEDAALLAIHCTIRIDDVDTFVADPEHTGSISGTVDYAPFGNDLPVTYGTFNLFSPGDPGERIMEYRLAFEHDGTSYLLDGKKHAHDDPGFDIWKDTTTLYSVLHESNESGTVVGAGVLSLGVEALTKMMATMRPTGDGHIEPVVAFGKLFLGSLWESYGADKLGKAL